MPILNASSRILVIPDSFKGSLSSQEICSLIEQIITQQINGVQVDTIVVADGGEGTVDAFLSACDGTLVEVETFDPYQQPHRAAYGMLAKAPETPPTAVVEMAQASGLPLVGDKKCAGQTSTFGTGVLIAHAAQSLVQGTQANKAKSNMCPQDDTDVERSQSTQQSTRMSLYQEERAYTRPRIIVGLGGSATNDGGCGAAAACGVCFFNKAGETFIPVGDTLIDIERIDISQRLPELDQVEIVTMCDIDNPLCGPLGASAVFGPQKGATPEQIPALDAGLKHLAQIVSRDLGIEIEHIPGAGAAGGMGAGMVGFFGSELQMGIETVLDSTSFESLARTADIILTGEGSLDEQSLRGKVVIGVAKRAQAYNTPVIALAGMIDEQAIPDARKQGVTCAVCINPVGEPLAQSLAHPQENLVSTINNLCQILREIDSCDELEQVISFSATSSS